MRDLCFTFGVHHSNEVSCTCASNMYKDYICMYLSSRTHVYAVISAITFPIPKAAYNTFLMRCHFLKPANCRHIRTPLQKIGSLNALLKSMIIASKVIKKFQDEESREIYIPCPKLDRFLMESVLRFHVSGILLRTACLSVTFLNVTCL